MSNGRNLTRSPRAARRLSLTLFFIASYRDCALTTVMFSDALLATHILFILSLFLRVSTIHAAILSPTPDSPSVVAKASARQHWHTPLQSPAGIAEARKLMTEHLCEPATVVDGAAVDALLGRMGGKWKAERYEGAEAKFKAQSFNWAMRKLMSKAPCELAYASAGGTVVACTFSSAGLLETSEAVDLGSALATEKTEAGRVTACWTTIGADGTMLNLQQGYLSPAARAADEVAYKQLTRYAVDTDSSPARMTLTEVTLTLAAGDDMPPVITSSWTHMRRA